MSLPQINEHLDSMRNEWISNKDKRIKSINASNSLLETALTRNTSVIDKIVNVVYTDINYNNGPLVDLDIHDIKHLSKMFPIQTIAKCSKFIYTHEAYESFHTNMPSRSKRKLCDSFGTLKYGLQKYDYSCERPRGYAYLSNRHEPITKHEYGKTYILSKVIVSYMDGDGYIALHAQPLYTITFNKAPF